VKVYAGMDPAMPIGDVAAHARRVEALGYDGLHLAETVHDALALALLAAEHTRRITIRTSVAVAFARSPTLLAYGAWDAARLSGGRFELGLGTQIRQNIEERFGMPFGDPVARMRDYLGALDALFTSFAMGVPLYFDGTYLHLHRLQPYFRPGPEGVPAAPPVLLGGVNAGVCELAGERAAGFVTHPTNSTPRYLTTVCRPHLAAGARRAGRDPAALDLVIGAPVITGRDGAALVAERERQRRLFAFLYSTPAYRRALTDAGLTELGPRLRAMVRSDRWDDLGSLVTDEVLDALVPSATYDELPAVLAGRFGALGTGLVLSVPPDPADDERFAPVVAAVRAISEPPAPW
jgi:probable F420-dependent oxidoreductase